MNTPTNAQWGLFEQAANALIAGLEVEGRKSVVTMCPPCVMIYAVYLEWLVQHWPQLPLAAKQRLAAASDGDERFFRELPHGRLVRKSKRKPESDWSRFANAAFVIARELRVEARKGMNAMLPSKVGRLADILVHLINRWPGLTQVMQRILAEETTSDAILARLTEWDAWDREKNEVRELVRDGAEAK
jgi:hypothetical protein